MSEELKTSEPPPDQKEEKEEKEKKASKFYESGKTVTTPVGKGLLGLQSGFVSMQGARLEMEDQVQILPHPRFNEELKVDGVPRSLFAVYDGHAGTVCAKYCLQHVHLNMAKSEVFGKDQAQALAFALTCTDKEFSQGCRSLNLHNSSGTTAIVAFFEDTKLYVANVGDSRAVMSRKGAAIALSVDQKPGRPDETKRIRKLGGAVGITEDEAFGRVRCACCCRTLRRQLSRKPLRVFPGGLSVSRTIGDIGLKATGLIIAEPEMKSVDLSPGDEFLILACDGVWDVISNQEAVDIARDHIDDPEAASEAIAKRAYKLGSTDNISIVIIFFKWQSQK